MADLGVDAATDAVEKLRDQGPQGAPARPGGGPGGPAGDPDGGDGGGGHRPEAGHEAQRLHLHRRQRRGQDHLHRQGGRQPEKAGQAGAAVRRRHLPGRRRRPAGDLGGAGRMRDRPAVRGGGPRRRAVRRTCRPPRPGTWTWCCATPPDGSTTRQT